MIRVSPKLRRRGARLSDGRRLDHLAVGERFVGVPLSSRLRYRCVIEVTGAIEPFDSHGAAWEVHGERAVPASLGPIGSAAAAQRFYETTFYEGRALVNAPVIAIPVRVVAWLDST